MASSDVWDEGAAARYDEGLGDMGEPEAIEPVLDVLAELAGDGRALEFAVGTGRIAVPLARRGVPTSGIELSAPMIAKLREKAGPDEVPVVLGDMATTRVEGEFAVAYLVFNTIGNLCTQDEQVACFANAAAHLRPGGRFVVEVMVPQLRMLPPGAAGVPFEVGPEHVGIDTYDPVTQRATSHHLSRTDDGTYRYDPHHFRYVWPAELDLMARLAGMTLQRRTADWNGAPFTADSPSHVSVWENSP